jgi:hypothetical protein
MIKRFLVLILIFFLADPVVFGQVEGNIKLLEEPLFAQSDTWLDSGAIVNSPRYPDSIKAIKDSLSMVWLKAPDPNRPNRFRDSLINLYKVVNLDFKAWAAKFPKKNSRFDEGKLRPFRESWVILLVLFLVLLYSLVRFFFPVELNSITHAFYSNQVLSKLNKEETLFNSWPFVFLYLLFGLILGLYLYLSANYFGISYRVEGFKLFLYLSATVIILFTLKIILLKIVGFLFDTTRLVRDYVSVLYISYFNAAILFLPIVIAFSLTSYRFSIIYSYLGGILLLLVFALQFLRVAENILSNYKLPKVYLFIYLCALEFCPLIILFKALGY